MVGRTGENFGVEKRWKKKKKIGQGGWDFRPFRKRPQRAHPQLVHWWVLIHSSLITTPLSHFFFSSCYILVFFVCILLCPCFSFAFWCAKCMKVSLSKMSLWTFNEFHHI